MDKSIEKDFMGNTKDEVQRRVNKMTRIIIDERERDSSIIINYAIGTLKKAILGASNQKELDKASYDLSMYATAMARARDLLPNDQSMDNYIDTLTEIIGITLDKHVDFVEERKPKPNKISKLIEKAFAEDTYVTLYEVVSNINKEDPEETIEDLQNKITKLEIFREALAEANISEEWAHEIDELDGFTMDFINEYQYKICHFEDNKEEL